ncbi:MAG: ATP-binding protein, partial [Thermoanaerobaculia bacterium]|nr:ATP-binding protein [Thermoanaerobaculia bacterium]
GFSEDESVGQSMFDLLIPEEIHEHARADLEMTLRQGEISGYEAPVKTKDGARRSIRWKAVVLSNNGSVQIVATGIDLTDLRESQKRRLQLEAQLAQAERIESLGRVAAKITHEFNNVLMGIQPFAEIVSLRAGDDSKLQTSADRIKQSILRGSNITREVLRFARPSEPVRHRVDVCDWLEELTEGHRVILGDGISISTHCDETVEMSVDRSQIDQVVVNLLANARDAMEGKGAIEIVASTPGPDETFGFGVVPDADRYVHIEVRDEGPGISKDILDELFEPFFTTKHKGTGLGLAISQQIVHAHEGQLFVRSKPGEGTSFHLFLPRAEGQGQG